MTDHQGSEPQTSVAPTPVEKNLLTPEQREAIEGRRDLLKALFFCFIAVVLVRSFIFEPFKIPSSSMEPTLKIGDHIFVSKFNYGLTVPFFAVEIVRWGAPRRGDVIVFLYPKDKNLHYIKRVVGIPGDEIEFTGDHVKVNGKRIETEVITDDSIISAVVGAPLEDAQLVREKLGEDHYILHKRHSVYDKVTNPTQTVPEDQYFVLGDNRGDSYDSRSWGFVPRENIKGKAQMIWLSLDQDSAWRSANKVRWERGWKWVR